jgi:hypothetical protein
MSAMTDREFVEQEWEHIATGAEAMYLSDYSAPIAIRGEGFRNWGAARAFTEERLEQIRQAAITRKGWDSA